MSPFIHSHIIGDLRFCPENIANPGIKQIIESSKYYIEKEQAVSSSTILPKKKQVVSLLLEDTRCRVRFSMVKTALLEDVPLASQMPETEKHTLWWCEDEIAIVKRCIATMRHYPM
jgi:hypothetical protein